MIEILTVASVVVGLIAGGIAVLEKAFHILPRNRGPRKILEREFLKWKEAGGSYLPSSHSDVTYFIPAVVRGNVDDERLAFALASVVYFGDRSLKQVIKRNESNPTAISVLFGLMTGRGVRVGWRAEYALSQLNRVLVAEYVANLPASLTERLAEPISRVTNELVEKFLQELTSSPDATVQAKANEVLSQIQAGSLWEWSSARGAV
jgi:hypothetical protein